jgi:hypothetical protein
VCWRAAPRRARRARAALSGAAPRRRWRYIDPSGAVQGPFDAGAMLTWYKAFYLHDMNLPICGTARALPTLTLLYNVNLLICGTARAPPGAA